MLAGQNAHWHDRLLWGLLLVVSLGVAVWAALQPTSAASVRARPKPIYGHVTDFTLLERSGRVVTRNDLVGKVWIAGLTFNCCSMSCPQMRSALQELQERLRNTGVVLVSISVDPENDTPASLQTMADSLQADARRWLFLTTDENRGKEYVYSVVEQSFGTRPLIDPQAEPGRRIAHSSRLFLIDRKGRVCGSYSCVTEDVDTAARPSGIFVLDEQELAQLAADADQLDGGPLRRVIRLARVPTLNAGLNATCTLLLVVGYVLIRRRRVGAHIRCMLAAVVVSAVFLASYLYYHANVGHTRFPEVWVRPIYLTILFSHIGLAVVIAVLVPRLLYLAARRRFPQHRRLARWTLPTWLYVSATGVVVYVFLYHLYPQ